jgi:hypothetical protein
LSAEGLVKGVVEALLADTPTNTYDEYLPDSYSVSLLMSHYRTSLIPQNPLFKVGATFHMDQLQ